MQAPRSDEGDPNDETRYDRSAERPAGRQHPMIASGEALAAVGIQLKGKMGTESLVEALFHSVVLTEGLARLEHAAWPSDATDPEIPGAQALLVTRGTYRQRAVLRVHGCLACVTIADGAVSVRVAHRADGEAEPVLADARQAFPMREARERTDDRSVPMWLWSGGGMGGARFTTRSVATPVWSEIAGNYAAETRDRLATLIQHGSAKEGGRIIVWTGEPGTGKTTALRSLAWEWRRRYALHCVVDPESLLGNPEYLLEVLSFVTPAPADDADHGSPGMLLVLEDAGELLARDARTRVGPGLARLLNLADGILGQGTDLRILITSNEPLGRLDAALTRPGRCAMQLDFSRLSVEEASAWLQDRGVASDCAAAATIAELYAALRGEERVAEESRIGFAT